MSVRLFLSLSEPRGNYPKNRAHQGAGEGMVRGAEFLWGAGLGRVLQGSRTNRRYRE